VFVLVLVLVRVRVTTVEGQCRRGEEVLVVTRLVVTQWSPSEKYRGQELGRTPIAGKPRPNWPGIQKTAHSTGAWDRFTDRSRERTDTPFLPPSPVNVGQTVGDD
jgi:hypothetical protein